MSSIKDMAAYDVADICGVFGSVGSGGVADTFFESVRDYTDEAIDEHTEDGEVDEDSALEMAEESIDGAAFLIYTGRVWDIFVDLELYYHGEGDLEPGANASMTERATRCVYNLAVSTARGLIEQAVDQMEDN